MLCGRFAQKKENVVYKKGIVFLLTIIIGFYQLEAQDFDFENDLSIQMVQILEKNVKYVFPYGGEGKVTTEIDGGFKFGKTEVTYAMWNYIRNWALKKNYTFQNIGSMGGKLTSKPYTPSLNDPVCSISWSDAIVWCNALTEYFNETYKSNLEYVYYQDSEYTIPFKQSSLIPEVSINKYPDNLFIKSNKKGNISGILCTANGFRIPDPEEWELVASYIGTESNDNVVTKIINGIDFLKLKIKYLRGDKTGNFPDSTEEEIQKYANLFSKHSVPVASYSPNNLGIYDISGNVSEWVNILAQSQAAKEYYFGIRGTSFIPSSSFHGILTSGAQAKNKPMPYLGFRIAQTATE